MELMQRLQITSKKLLYATSIMQNGNFADQSKPAMDQLASNIEFRNPKCVCSQPRCCPTMIHMHLQVNPKPATWWCFIISINSKSTWTISMRYQLRSRILPFLPVCSQFLHVSSIQSNISRIQWLIVLYWVLGCDLNCFGLGFYFLSTFPYGFLGVL